MENNNQMNDAQKRAQRSRSTALGIVLVAFVIIIYVATWYKMGVQVLVRPM